MGYSQAYGLVNTCFIIRTTNIGQQTYVYYYTRSMCVQMYINKLWNFLLDLNKGKVNYVHLHVTIKQNLRYSYTDVLNKKESKYIRVLSYNIYVYENDKKIWISKSVVAKAILSFPSW